MSHPAKPGTHGTKPLGADDQATFQRWEPPTVDGDLAHTATVGLVTAKQVERIQSEAYEEGFAQGQQDGSTAARFELEALLNGLVEPLADLDDTVMQELTTLITVVARQLVRRELTTQPGEIVAVVREALAALPATARTVRVHLHPEDAKLVRDALSLTDDDEHRWHLVEDSVQARGDCRVLTETSQIDASLERRLTAVITKMLGGDRRDDDESK